MAQIVLGTVYRAPSGIKYRLVRMRENERYAFLNENTWKLDRTNLTEMMVMKFLTDERLS